MPAFAAGGGGGRAPRRQRASAPPSRGAQMARLALQIVALSGALVALALAVCAIATTTTTTTAAVSATTTGEAASSRRLELVHAAAEGVQAGQRQQASSSPSNSQQQQQQRRQRATKLVSKRETLDSSDDFPPLPPAPIRGGGSAATSLWRQAPVSAGNTTTATTTTTASNFHHPQLRRSPESGAPTLQSQPGASGVCSDRLCYGLPMGCLERAPAAAAKPNAARCSVLVTSKYLIDPYRPVARDIHFELVALPVPGQSNYAAVGFSSTGRMAGLVSECLQYRDANTKLQIISLAHSYNIPGAYTNVPVTVLSGIKNLGVSFENGYYQCRWIVESAVEFTYEDPVSGQLVQKREDLGYKDYHILLASGAYNERTNVKSIHSDRVGSLTPVSLAQTGHIKSLGSHILIRIHGSLMIAIWMGMVTMSILIARYYKNEWANSKINDTAIWFVVHRALMLIAWFGTIIAVIFAYMYTETYHPGPHQIAGTTCLAISTIQVLGGLLRPSPESTKRVYFNWTHFLFGNLGYLCAMICIITAAFLVPAHLPPIYIWVVAAFVSIYTLTHILMTFHQYMVHKSSKISITPMSDLNDANLSNMYSSCGFIADSYPKEGSSSFRQVMLGILVTISVIFIVSLISMINMNHDSI